MAVCSFKSDKDFVKIEKVEVDQQPVEGGKVFKCNQCGRNFNKKSSIVCHMRLHTGEKPFACTQCSSRFTHKSSLLHHSRLHTGEKPYECEICHKKFRQRPNYSLHKITHNKEKSFECEICGKQFAQRVHLTTHRRLHTGEKPFVCKECNRKFSQQCHLTRHQRTHSGDKEHECKVCEKRFSCSAYLKSHLKIHTVEKPQKSKKRDKSNLQKSAFYNPVNDNEFNQDSSNRISLKQKKQGSFECEFCHKRCIKKSHLKHHIFVHTGEKPYECQKCNKKFSEKGSLTRHMKVHDGTRPPHGMLLGSNLNGKDLSKCEITPKEIVGKLGNTAKPFMVCVGTDDHTDFVVSSDFGKIISISQGPIPVPVEGSKILPSMLPDKTFPEVVFREDTMYQQFNKDSKIVSNVTLGHEEVTDNTFPSRVEPLKQTSRIQVVHSTGRKEVVNLIESKDNVNFADTSSKMDSAGILSKQCPQVSKHPSSSKYYGYNEQCANGLLPLKYCEESKSQHLYICTFVASSESLPPKNSVAASESLPPVDTLPSGSFSPTEYEPIRPHYISVQPQALNKQEAFMTPAANGGTREDGQEVTQDSQTSCGRSAGDGSSSSEVPVAVSVFLYGQEVKEENVSCEVNIKQEVDVVEEALDSPCSIYH